ncbi:MAG: DEAD/DEAH box helicase [Deltaproteobacteria bacterium]|nr:DEAD/DEAH box helicase [Deltaproteobacteria bacterium]
MTSPTSPRANLRFDRGTLLLSGVEREALVSLRTIPWEWDPRVGAWRCEAHLYSQVRALLEAGAAPVDDEVTQPLRVGWPTPALPELRPDQQGALQAWQKAGGRGVVVMPTGTGKTEVALAAMQQASVATLVVAPVRDLMYQWHRRIRRGLGFDAGILGDSTRDVRPVTVTTYDSAYIHMAELGARFGMIVFDEAHHLPGKVRREAAVLCAAPLRLGLTATPERSDGQHEDLDWLIGPVVFRLAVSEAKGRTLADYDVVRIPVTLTEHERQVYEQAGQEVSSFIREQRAEYPDYGWKDVCTDSGKNHEARRAHKAFRLRKSIEDRAQEKLRVLEDLFRLHAGERVIVFAGSNAMAFEVSRRFLLPTLLSHSGKDERAQVLEGFEQGRFPAIVANQVLDEGVDVPAAKVAVVIGGMASTRQAKQRLGRILRRKGDVKATLYEVVCEDTGEIERSRSRRRSDAYERAIHRRV